MEAHSIFDSSNNLAHSLKTFAREKNLNRYRCCFVPMCTSSSAKTPDKLFLSVPSDRRNRKRWCNAARRKNLTTGSNCFCCEDHFNVSYY